MAGKYLWHIPCPSLCRQCKHFTHSKTSNVPYQCHSGSTASAAEKSRPSSQDAKTGGRTFDDCAKFSEKPINTQKEDTTVNINNIDNKQININAMNLNHLTSGEKAENAKKPNTKKESRDHISKQPDYCVWCGKMGYENDLGNIYDHVYTYYDIISSWEDYESDINYKSLWMHSNCFENEFLPKKQRDSERIKEERKKRLDELRLEMRAINNKTKIRKIIQFVILPFAVSILLQFIFGINIFSVAVNEIGVLVAFGIQYIMYLIITLFLQSKFDVEFTHDENIIKSISINIICFIIAIFAIKYLARIL